MFIETARDYQFSMHLKLSAMHEHCVSFLLVQYPFKVLNFLL